MSDEWPGQRLHQYAIFDRDDSMIDILQGEERKNINAPDRCGRTPVYTAVSNNSIKCLQILLQNGADPSLAGGERVRFQTPLHQALLDGKMDAVVLLLEYGADLNTIDESGLSPINLSKSISDEKFITVFKQEDERRRRNALEVVIDLCNACENGDLEKVKDIMRLPAPTGWELANMSVPGDLTRTPLSVAAKKGDVTVMSELLSSVSAPKHSPSLIHVAVKAGHVGIVRLLLQNYPECCNNEDEKNQTPLHLACQTGSLEIVTCLLEWNYPEAMYKPVYIEEDALEYKCVILVNRTRNDGKTALYLATEFGHETIVEYLLNYTVEARKVASKPVSYREKGDRGSVHSNHSSESEPVGGNGADIVEGNTPRSSILVVAEENIVRYRPVKITQAISYSLSSIYIAVERGYHNIVSMLAKAGSMMNLRVTEKGVEYSALLLLAFKNNDLLMLDKLLQHNVKDLNNHVLQEAVQSKPTFIPHFLKYKASEDKQNSINKSGMKMEYAQLTAVSSDNLEELPSVDPKYMQVFPTHPVNVRWQNLKVLPTVEQSWLTYVANMYNTSMTNVNARIPLFAITRVDVSNNKLLMMPTSLLQLPSLCALIASDNQISEFPNQKNFSLDCRCLEDLSIQNNKLTTIPDYVFTLPSLRCVNAVNNLIRELPPSMWQACSLTLIDLSQNRLEELPNPNWSSISSRKESETDSEFSPLEESEKSCQSQHSNESLLIENDFKRANHWTGNLEISDEDVKAAENRYKGLKTLRLGQNKIKEFPEFLSCCCPQLEVLEMPKNKLQRLGNIAAYPKLLKVLDLSNNLIEDMADWQKEEEYGKFFCTKTRRNSMTTSTDQSRVSMFGAAVAVCGHRRHAKLENLETLELASNKLTSLVVLRTADNVPNQQDLTASQAMSLVDKETKEQDLQGKLLFPNLNNLNVDMNQLSRLPEDIGELKVLKIFSLKKNTQLRELPPKLGLLEKLQRIEVDLCPIEGPIQDVIKGASNRASDVTGFLRSVLEESEQYNCMNLMIVGSFNIGKTSLLEELVRTGTKAGKRTHFNQRQDKQGVGTTKDGKPLSTVGIDISQLVLSGKHGKVEFRTWDFAGQTEYYATHQYFLSPRSLYLVVWNLTKGEPGVADLRQWLVNIQAQAPGAPVIIVGTHLDEVKNKKLYAPDWEESMTKLVRDRYIKYDGGSTGLPRVLDTINVAAVKKSKSVEKLKNKIYDVVFNLTHPARKNEKMLGHKVPKKYMKLQECIQNIVRERNEQNKEPVLNSTNYLLTVMSEMTREESNISFRNKEDLYQATRFLHENGVLCHFADTSLKDQYFLDPQWLCDQLAKVVSIQEVQKYAKQGVMKVTDLKRLYRDSDRIGQYILSLLNKFEVALQFDAENLLLPSLLPTADNLEVPMMREIPVKRKGIDVSSRNQSVDSISSFGLSMLNQPLSSTSTGEMYIANSIAEKNPAFSNTRLYLLTYFPSGFWPRLISRILADESFYEPLIRMYPFPQDVSEKCYNAQKEVPAWRCWQTGLELVYFNNVIMQVKEIKTASQYAQGMCNYDMEGLKLKCFFDDNWGELDVSDSAMLEISFQADYITFNIGFQESIEHRSFQSIESKQIYHDEKAKACILSKVVEHMDSLLQDWYPEIGESRFLQSCTGRYLVTRVIPCPLCLQAEINHEENAPDAFISYSLKSDVPQLLSITDSTNIASGKQDGKENDTGKVPSERVIYTFLVEKCIQNVLEGIDEMCKVHGSVSPTHMPTEDGTIRVLYVAPDVVFQDLDERFVVEDDSLQVAENLGRGAFGTVSAGKLKRGEHTTFDVAVKVLYDHREKDRKKQPSQMSLETVCAAYTTARQEVSILQTVEHPHIVPLLGLSRRPLALLLSLAPLGCLTNIMESRHKDGLKLPVWVIKHVIIQTAEALDYLHNLSIIYRDLKSDNVLVWKFPGPSDLDPRQPVLIKLADYGISRPVMPGGGKGFGGTPPFIAPEILVHAGRDTYTNKVDIFSFGMFMFELLTCRMPLAEINNPTVHVCHGGRPTITNEEAVYPSHLLDLMTICWAHEPQNRPSALQICMIASSPQFCHLSDAVTMETESVVNSACTVYTEDSNSVDQTQLWIASQIGGNYHVEILSYNRNHKCTAYKELKQENKILAMCNVNNTIWCFDIDGVILVYSSSTLDKVMDYQLPVNHPVFLVYAMTYHHGDGGHVAILFRECKENATTLFCLTEKLLWSTDPVEPIKIARECFSAAIVKSTDSLKVWLGSVDGEIAVRNVNNLEVEERRLSPHSDPSRQRCIYIATALSTHVTRSAWSYNYPGSRVLRWDTDKEVVVATLDCSNLIPATDSYRVQKARTFEANHYQVTALSVVDKYLYVSTTWGCIIVANANSLQPLSVYRCHGDEDFYCKSILPLGPSNSVDQDSEILYSRNNSHPGAQGREANKGDRGLVTIGRGYVDIVNHETHFKKQAFLRQDTDEGFALVDTGSAPTPPDLAQSSHRNHTYILSWIAKDWEFY